MKKLKIELSYSQATGLDEWLNDVLPLFDKSDAIKCVAAVLHSWRMNKLKPKTYYPTTALLKFTLDLQTCYAFAYIIAQINPNHCDHVGARLTKLFYEINKTIN